MFRFRKKKRKKKERTLPRKKRGGELREEEVEMRVGARKRHETLK